ncbi:hypothetical protein [Embleya hyalina]|nr:hypothetical protein [Embleya hyalina]
MVTPSVGIPAQPAASPPAGRVIHHRPGAPTGTSHAANAPGTTTDEATRYLCAAVHLDSRLAEKLVEDVLEEPLRAVVRSPGVDLVAVMKHAIAARARHLTRDAALAALLILAVVSFLTIGSLAGVVVVVASWAVVVAEAYVARWGALAQTLRRGTFDASRAPDPQWQVTRDQIALVATYAAGNVSTYSGFDPFLGHGWTLDSWSFALDTTVPCDEQPVVSFTASELRGRLTSRIALLDLPGLGVHDRLFINGADIHHDSRFLTGRNPRPVDRVSDAVLAYLTEHPEDRARPYLVVEIVGWGGQLVYSLFLRVTVGSSHLFVEVNHSLLPPLHWRYYEIDDLLLRPTFGELTRLVVASGFRWFGLMFRCIPRTLKQIFASLRRRWKQARQRRMIAKRFTFNHGALLSIRQEASDLRSRVPDRFPSLGPVLDPMLSPVIRTVLRLGLDSNGLLIGYHRYFQKLDQEMYTKVVEKRIFDTLVDFLEEKNIDPAELKRRAETIVNNSLTVGAGATVTGSAFSVGRGASATSNGKP